MSNENTNSNVTLDAERRKTIANLAVKLLESVQEKTDWEHVTLSASYSGDSVSQLISITDKLGDTDIHTAPQELHFPIMEARMALRLEDFTPPESFTMSVTKDNQVNLLPQYPKGIQVERRLS